MNNSDLLLELTTGREEGSHIDQIVILVRVLRAGPLTTLPSNAPFLVEWNVLAPSYQLSG